MGTKTAELAGQFEKALADFAAAINGCSDEAWGAMCDDEGWTIAATAQHVAGQFPLEREFISAAADGRPIPAYTWDDINGKNDTRAAAHTKSSKAEVLNTLRDEGSSMAAYVRSLGDDQLEKTASFPLANGASLSVQQLIEGGVLIEHVRGHLASIQKRN